MDFHGDTEIGVWQAYYEGLRRMSVAERWNRMIASNQRARETMAAGVRLRHPDYDDRQVKLAVARLAWGEEVFRRFFPDENVQP